MTIRNDWGVPDWLDASAYPRPVGRARMLVWAWEFLRRNKKYKLFWEREVCKLIHDGVVPAQGMDVVDEASDRFGLLYPRDPRIPGTLGPPLFERSTRRWRIRSYDHETPTDVTLASNELAYVFDLTLPLRGQFDRALQDAKWFQERLANQGGVKVKSSKERDDKYVSYLRLIDAEDRDVRPRRIASVLFPNKSNEYSNPEQTSTFKNHRTAAHLLCDGGYRDLINLSIAPSKAK